MQSNLGCLKCLGRSNQEDVSQSTTTGSAFTEKGGTAGAGLHGDDAKSLPLGMSSCRVMPASCATHRGVRVCQVCHRHTEPSGTGRQDAEEAAGWGRAECSGWWRLPRLTCQIRPALRGFKYGCRLLLHARMSLS